MPGKSDDALACFKKLTGLNPGLALVWTEMGVLYSDVHEEYEKAIRCLQRATRLDEDSEKAWRYLGLARLKGSNDVDGAIEAINTALELTETPEGWFQKGNIMGRYRKDYKEAISCYDEAIALDDDDAKSWYNKGIALGKLGRNDEKIFCMKRVLEIDPGNQLAKQELKKTK